MLIALTMTGCKARAERNKEKQMFGKWSHCSQLPEQNRQQQRLKRLNVRQTRECLRRQRRLSRKQHSARMPSPCFAVVTQKLWVKCMRDLAVASGAGLSSGSLLALLGRLSEPPVFPDCLPCPLPSEISLSSLLLGIGIGVLLLPTFEALWLFRAALHRRLFRLLQLGTSYYRVI